MLGIIALTIIRRLTRAVSEPSPERVQAAVKMMLLSLLMLDATLVVYVSRTPVYGIAVAAMLLPAFFLAKRIPMT